MPHFLRVGSSSPSVFDIRCNSASSFPSNGGSTSGGNLRRLRNVQKKPCMTFQYSDWLIGILTLAQKNLPIELGSITHYNNYMSGALSTAQVNRCFPNNKSEVLVVKNMFQCKCHTTSITKHTYFLWGQGINIASKLDLWRCWQLQDQKLLQRKAPLSTVEKQGVLSTPHHCTVTTSSGNLSKSRHSNIEIHSWVATTHDLRGGWYIETLVKLDFSQNQLLLTLISDGHHSMSIWMLNRK